MFGFMRKSGVRSPSTAMQKALEKGGLPRGTDAATLGVLESRGNYAGRKVTYIRVFDTARAAAHDLPINSYGDLDPYRNLILRTGHVEKDGAVVITWRAPPADATAPTRGQADRTQHADDEKFVFTSGER